MRGDRRARRGESPPSAASPATTDADLVPSVKAAVDVPASDDPKWDLGPVVIDPHRLSLLLESSNRFMLRAIATARQIASFELPVLLTGETGTGKSVLAAAIHGWSQRMKGPFVTVSCRAPDKARHEPMEPVRAPTAVPYDDEGFPHAVPYGTLFLDEVGMLSNAAQAKLIRFLDEDRSATLGIEQTAGDSTRVIAASSRDLEADVRAGRFRHELFFRLNVVTIHLPPLRERREDIPQLTAKILAEICERHHRPPLQLTPEVRTALAAYTWRGNLRELATVLEHSVILARTNMVQLTDLPERIGRGG